MTFWTLLVANTRLQLRNRSSLFWHFAFPLVFMVLFGLIFGQGAGMLNIGMVTDNSVPAQHFEAAFAEIEGAVLIQGAEAALLEDLKDGQIHLLVAFRAAEAGQPLDVELFYDQNEMLASGMARSMVRGVLDGITKAVLAVPELFRLKETVISTEVLNFMSFLLPGVIGMSIMFSALFGTAYPLVTEREKGILRRVKLTPVKTSVFLGAKAVGMTVIAFMQAAIIIATGISLFDVQILGSLPAAAFVTLLGALMMVSLGLLLAGVAKRVESVDSIANAIAMPMMFLAGTFFEIDGAPDWLQSVAGILPLTHLNSALRDILIRGQELADVLPALLTMVAWALIFILAAAYLFKWESPKIQGNNRKAA